MLLTVNVLVLLTAATQLHAQFLFFADWTDLQGAFGRNPTSTPVARATRPVHPATRQGPATPPTPTGGLHPLPPGPPLLPSTPSFLLPRSRLV